MPAPRESDRQEAMTRDSRRRQVERLYVAGYTQAEMVKSLKDAGARRVSSATISRDMAALKKQWRDDNTDAGEQYLEHVRHIDGEIEFWRRRVLTTTDADAALAAYTGAVLPLLKERAKLLGLYPPRKVDVSGFVRNWAIERGYDPERAVELAQDVVDSTGF